MRSLRGEHGETVKGLRAATGGALGGGRGAERFQGPGSRVKNSPTTRYSVGSGPPRTGGWIVPTGSVLSFEEAVSKEQQEETNQEGGGEGGGGTVKVAGLRKLGG